MDTKRLLKLFFIVIFLFVSTSGCAHKDSSSSTSGRRDEKETQIEKLPPHALFALCHLSATVAVVDVDNWIGSEIASFPEIRAVSDLALNDQGVLFLVNNGEMDEIGNTLFSIVPETGDIQGEITVPDAPYRISIAPSGIAVVSHIVIEADDHTYVSFVDTHNNRFLQSRLVDGSVVYVKAMDKTAYVLVNAWNSRQENQLLLYDYGDFNVRKRYVLPQGIASLDDDFLVSRHHVYYVNIREPEEGTLKFEIIDVNLDHDKVHVLAELDTAGEIGILENGNLLVTPGRNSPTAPIRLVDSVTGNVLKEQLLGNEANHVEALGNDLFAITLEEANEIVLFDGKSFQEVERSPAPCDPFVLRMHYAEN